jgi:hypothetical protein
MLSLVALERNDRRRMRYISEHSRRSQIVRRLLAPPQIAAVLAAEMF